MPFVASNAFTDLTVTSVDDTTVKVEFKLPLKHADYQNDTRVLFPALLESLDTGINSINPKPASVLVSKTTNVVNIGTSPQIRDSFVVTIVRQAVPGNLIPD